VTGFRKVIQVRDGWLSLYFLAAMACSIERKCGGGGVSGVCRDRISCLDCIGMSVLVAVEVSLGSIDGEFVTLLDAIQ